MHKPKTKSRTKSRTPHLHAQPLLMIQVFATPPYIIAKGDQARLDDPRRVEDFLTKVQTMARELIAPPDEPPEKVRVSGVPYAVEAHRIHPNNVPRGEGEAFYELRAQPEDSTHG